jgi:galactokinase
VRAEKGGGAQAAYNERVASCRAAAAALGAPTGGVLAFVPGSDRAERARALPDRVLAARAGFVFEEAMRVDAAAAALIAGDLGRLGALLDGSHRGLAGDYEVSHPAVDALVAAARRAGALGARIVGAGFGGSAIALTTHDRADALAAALRAAGAVSAFVAAPSDGARRASRVP